MEPIKISREGVYKLIKNINPSKATGPDTIAGRVLKENIVSNDLVNNNVRMSVHISIFSFSTLPAIVSGPVALLGFMFFMSL
jgi:hypothetical protein